MSAQYVDRHPDRRLQPERRDLLFALPESKDPYSRIALHPPLTTIVQSTIAGEEREGDGSQLNIQVSQLAQLCESQAQLTATFACDWRIPALSKHIIFSKVVAMRRLTLACLLLLVRVSVQGQASGPQISVRHLNLDGAVHISQADQRQIALDIEKQKYDESSVAEISARIRYAFQERSFFKASAAAPRITVVSSSPSEEIIDVTCEVHEGRQYRLEEITFDNVQGSKNLAFPSDELRQAFPIADGKTFNTEEIRLGLDQLRKLYVSKGYVNFTPVPITKVDDLQGMIVLRVDIDEGVVFRVGALVLDGVEPVPGAGAKLMQSWKQYEGRVYDGQILATFIRENAAYLPPHAEEGQLFEFRQEPSLHILNFRLDLGDVARTN